MINGGKLQLHRASIGWQKPKYCILSFCVFWLVTHSVKLLFTHVLQIYYWSVSLITQLEMEEHGNLAQSPNPQLI